MASSTFERTRPHPESRSPAAANQAPLRAAAGLQRSAGQALPAGERSLMESRFGHRFDQVRVHADGPAAATAERLGAKAVTAGSTIAFAPGRFEPGSSATRRTLAHELTHVVQQGAADSQQPAATVAPAPSSRAAETEAARNAERVAAGAPAAVQVRSPAGVAQLEKDVLEDDEKKEAKKKDAAKVTGSTKVERGFDKKAGEEAKNNFAVTAEVKVPLLPGPQLGSTFFLKELTIKNKGSAAGPEPFSLGSVRLTKMQSDAALDILKAEVPKGELPKALSLGAAIKGSGSISRDLDKGQTTGSAGVTASVEQGVKVEDLIPDSAGSLTLGAKLGGSAAAKQTFGGESPGSSGSLAASVGGSVDFKSRPLRGPLATVGGLLGDEAQIGVGASTDFSAGLDSEKGATSKFGAGGKIGLSGKRAFIDLTVKSEVELDPAGGKFKATSTKVIAGGAVGFKF